MAITNAPVQGVYRIANAARLASALDVGYFSTSNMAPVLLCTDADTNNEKFYLRRVTAEASGTGDVFEIVALHCGKLVTKTHPDGASGADVVQYARQGSDIQRWRPVPSGTATLNGATVYKQKVCNLATTLVLATKGGSTADITPIQCLAFSDVNARKWVFVKDSFHDATLAAPTDVGLTAADPSSKKNKGRRHSTAIASSEAYWVTFLGAKGSGVQLRYRSRQMNSSLQWGGWSYWRAVNVTDANGAKNDDGWRDAWSYYSCSRTPNPYETEHYAPSVGSITIAAPTTSAVRKEFQFEIRNVQSASSKAKGACGISTLAHGNSLVQSVIVDKMPTLAVDVIAMTCDGIAVGYSSDATTGGNSVTAKSIKVGGAEILKGAYTATGKNASGSFIIPFSKLRTIPAEGASATIRAALTSRFGHASDEVTATKSVTYDAYGGLVVAVTQTMRGAPAQGKSETVDHSVAVSISATRSGEAVSVTHEDTTVLCAWTLNGKIVTMEGEPRESQSEWNVFPPLNADWTLMVFVRSGGYWGARHADGLAVSTSHHVLNPRTFNAWDAAHLDVDLFGDVDHTSWSLSNDVSTWKCLGATLDAGAAADASSGEIRLSCVLPGESTTYACIEDLKRMVDEASCIYRTPDGGVHHVIIESASWNRIDAGNWYECDISMREVE